MKGVVLADGTGSRLSPLTQVTNKHVLPVYDKPMVYYPIQMLLNAGIHQILIATGGETAGDLLRLLGNGRHFGLKHLKYTYQEGNGGIAEALALAEYFATGEQICVVLGDNIIENNICHALETFTSRPSLMWTEASTSQQPRLKPTSREPSRFSRSLAKLGLSVSPISPPMKCTEISSTQMMLRRSAKIPDRTSTLIAGFT